MNWKDLKGVSQIRQLIRTSVTGEGCKLILHIVGWPFPSGPDRQIVFLHLREAQKDHVNGRLCFTSEFMSLQ